MLHNVRGRLVVSLGALFHINLVAHVFVSSAIRVPILIVPFWRGFISPISELFGRHVCIPLFLSYIVRIDLEFDVKVQSRSKLFEINFSE